MDGKGFASTWSLATSLFLLWCGRVLSQPSAVDTSTTNSYPLCTGMLNYIGDGDCDASNNNAECGWDGGDCCSCTCENGDSYTCGPYFNCQDEDAWCYSDTTAPTSSPTASPSSSSPPACAGIFDDIADGFCHAYNNNAECSYDGGDCCSCTCVDGPVFRCPFLDCQDPNAGCKTDVPSATPTSSPTGMCAGNGEFHGDGDCDGTNNNAACDYDGGDCCECTCEDGPIYTCGPSFSQCEDPFSQCDSSSTTPTPFYGRSSTDSADGPTSGSTSSGISTAVVASACAAVILFVGLIVFCARRRHLERKRGRTGEGDHTTATDIPPPTVPSQISVQGTRAGIDQDVQGNTIVGPFPVAYDQPEEPDPAATMRLPFREIGEEGVEASNPVESATNYPVAILEPPLYREATESAE